MYNLHIHFWCDVSYFGTMKQTDKCHSLQTDRNIFVFYFCCDAIYYIDG